MYWLVWSDSPVTKGSAVEELSLALSIKKMPIAVFVSLPILVGKFIVLNILNDWSKKVNCD
jgi:hypothetical protein